MSILSILFPLALFILFVKIVFGNSSTNNSKNNKMGCASSASDISKEAARSKTIANNYRTLAEVEQGLRKSGLESSDMILAIDFTKSNSWQGERSFGGLNLHAISSAPGNENPYQQVISCLAEVLVKKLDDDASVPMYGFGDSLTGNRTVFLMNNEKPCASKEELLAAYSDAATHVTLAGPTSFAPIIREAIDICRSTGKYHILAIVADGLMDDVKETIDAIVAASRYPLSIVMIGVGDGPWDQMEIFDDELPERDFDNFQFLSYTKLQQAYRDPHQRAMHFALEALMELPEQYQFIKKTGLLGKQPEARVPFQYRLRGKHMFPAAFHMVEGYAPGSAPPAYNSR